MISPDKYRAAARNAAWYDEEGDPPTYNPFRKIHKRVAPVVGDEEHGHPLTQHKSEADALDAVHKQRRSQILEEYPEPKHAATMPSSSGNPANKSPVDPDAPTTDTRDMAIGHENDSHFGHENEEDIGHEHEKGVSQDSQDSSPPISDSTAVGSDPQIGGQGTTTRRRFAFMGNLGKSGEDKEATKEAKRRGRSASWLKRDKQTFTAVGQFKATILNSWVNVLLVFVPIGIAVNFANVPPIGVFVINFIAIIPLAAMLSYATEEIAIRTGETIGGLLNATFG
jgi:Ca2+:H+ antiporter